VTAEAFSIDVVNPVGNTTEQFPIGVIGKPYMLTLTASGGSPPYAWLEAQGLPPGLSLNASGVVSGIPTATGSFRLSAIVADTGVNAFSDTGLYGTECCGGRMQVISSTIEVDEALHIATSSLSGGITGQPYGGTLEARGGGTAVGRRWSIRSGALPEGLRLPDGPRPVRVARMLTVSEGVISIGGVPTRAGRFDFVVEVDKEDGETDSKPLSIVVVDPLKITESLLPAGLVSKPYSEALSASGGVPPYVWSIQSAALPAGLKLDQTTGAILGVPLTSGSFSVAVWLSDSAGHTASTLYSLVIRSH
jgi:hypothetical protein